MAINNSFLDGLDIPPVERTGNTFTINVHLNLDLQQTLRRLLDAAAYQHDLPGLLARDALTPATKTKLLNAVDTFMPLFQFSYHGHTAARPLRPFRSESFDMLQHDGFPVDSPIDGFVRLLKSATQTTCDLLAALVRTLELDAAASEFAVRLSSCTEHLTPLLAAAESTCEEIPVQCEAMNRVIRLWASHRGHLRTDGRHILKDEIATFKLAEATFEALQECVDFWNDQAPHTLRRVMDQASTEETADYDMEFLMRRIFDMHQSLLVIPHTHRSHFSITFLHFGHPLSDSEDSELTSSEADEDE